MNATDTAAVIVAIASVVAVVLLAVALVSVTRTLRAIRDTVEQLRRETVPMVSDLQHTVRQANSELERIDQVLVSAESVSATVESVSHLAYLAFSNPVIKVLAFATGTAKATKALRRGR